MKIVCATSVLGGREALEPLGELVMVPDEAICADVVRDASVLIVRSQTRVNESLLAKSSVSFVGTATAGYDHLDTEWLEAQGIVWCAAPGCNANSVAEYVITALLHLASLEGRRPEETVLGIVGVGRIGSRVSAKAEALGYRVLWNDPPLALATNDPRFLPLREVLGEADVLTFHVPLTRTGPCPTYRLVNCALLEDVKPGVDLINTSRGDIVDEDALLLALDRGVVRGAVLDVWVGEPHISAELLQRVTIGTPHVAGYSLEGRLRGTHQVYQQLCRFLETPAVWEPDFDALPGARTLSISPEGLSDTELLAATTMAACDLRRDDRALREGDPREDLSSRFRRLRHEYPVRREFSAFRVENRGFSADTVRKLTALGFKV